MDEQSVLNELVRLSAFLGRPENDYVILGEGNTSAKIDDEFFYVKASGKYLCDAVPETFVKVKLKAAQEILDKGPLTDDEVKSLLFGACADPNSKLRPSIETTFHAFLLGLPDVNFVGHTHATAVNSLLCSVNAKEIIQGGRIFPDEIAYCGLEPMFLEYADPGVELGRAIRQNLNEYVDRNCEPPKVILVRNHGIIALGKTSHQVEAITAMWCKVARVLRGASIFGGIHYLERTDVNRICHRPDEEQRLAHFK